MLYKGFATTRNPACPHFPARARGRGRARHCLTEGLQRNVVLWPPLIVLRTCAKSASGRKHKFFFESFAYDVTVFSLFAEVLLWVVAAKLCNEA